MRRAIIDLRSVLWTAIMAGKDKWRYELVIDKTKGEF